MVLTVMDAVEWYVLFWKGLFAMRFSFGSLVCLASAMLLVALAFGSVAQAQDPFAPPIDHRFDVRLDNVEGRITDAEERIEALTKELAAVKASSVAACKCEPEAKAEPAKTTVSIPLEKPTTKTTRTVCGPNGCYEVESNPFAAPRAYQGGCSGGSCGVKARRGFFGRVFGRRVR